MQKYNPIFLEKLDRDFLPEYIQGCNLGEEKLYFRMLLDNIYEIDSNLEILNIEEKYFFD